MIRLQPYHWTFAFLVALAIHVSAYVSSLSLPGAEPVYRGGGSFEQAGKPSPSAAGVFVRLGKSGESAGEKAETAALKELAPVAATRESLAQGFAAGDAEPGSGTAEAEPSQSVEPPAARLPEPAVAAVAKEAGRSPEKAKEEGKAETKTVAPAAPKRKPKQAVPLPELETLGRRLSVQGPTASASQAVPPGSSGRRSGSPDTAREATKSESEARATQSLSFASRGGGVGTASGNTTGEVRELNYEDMVLLWLKRHGAYPYEAAMYRLEDTVTVKFTINRQGVIRSYDLIKKSKWILLNRAVEQMMGRSSPVPPIPPEIAKNELTFTVPVHFDPH